VIKYEKIVTNHPKKSHLATAKLLRKQRLVKNGKEKFVTK